VPAVGLLTVDGVPTYLTQVVDDKRVPIDDRVLTMMCLLFFVLCAIEIK
jgi:hypothetical protein